MPPTTRAWPGRSPTPPCSASTAACGKDRLEPGDRDVAEQIFRGLVDEAVRGQTLPSDTLLARIVARRVARDLARFVRQDAERPSPLAPTRLEVAFGGVSSAPG